MSSLTSCFGRYRSHRSQAMCSPTCPPAVVSPIGLTTAAGALSSSTCSSGNGLSQNGTSWKGFAKRTKYQTAPQHLICSRESHNLQCDICTTGRYSVVCGELPRFTSHLSTFPPCSGSCPLFLLYCFKRKLFVNGAGAAAAGCCCWLLLRPLPGPKRPLRRAHWPVYLLPKNLPTSSLSENLPVSSRTSLQLPRRKTCLSAPSGQCHVVWLLRS